MHGGDYNPVKELQAARAANAGLRAKIMALHDEHKADMEAATTETEGDSDDQARGLPCSLSSSVGCMHALKVLQPASWGPAWLPGVGAPSRLPSLLPACTTQVLSPANPWGAAWRPGVPLVALLVCGLKICATSASRRAPAWQSTRMTPPAGLPRARAMHLLLL
jgi:hypothetical protein